MHPIPRPRPHGPADLGVLAKDLDRLAGVNTGFDAPELEPGRDAYARVSASDPYNATDTEAEAAEETDLTPAGPVFVDASGRRRRIARRAGLVALVAGAGYAGLLAVSFVGGPIPPNALLPVPGMPSKEQPAPSSIAQKGADPTAASSGADGHPTTTSRSTKPGSNGRTENRATTTAGAPGQATPSVPQATSTGATAPSVPAPTSASAGTSATNSHGNPTPPGRSHKSSSPGPTG